MGQNFYFLDGVQHNFFIYQRIRYAQIAPAGDNRHQLRSRQRKPKVKAKVQVQKGPKLNFWWWCYCNKMVMMVMLKRDVAPVNYHQLRKYFTNTHPGPSGPLLGPRQIDSKEKCILMHPSVQPFIERTYIACTCTLPLKCYNEETTNYFHRRVPSRSPVKGYVIWRCVSCAPVTVSIAHHAMY